MLRLQALTMGIAACNFKGRGKIYFLGGSATLLSLLN
jgi:hypothetical protein